MPESGEKIIRIEYKNGKFKQYELYTGMPLGSIVLDKVELEQATSTYKVDCKACNVFRMQKKILKTVADDLRKMDADIKSRIVVLDSEADEIGECADGMLYCWDVTFIACSMTFGFDIKVLSKETFEVDKEFFSKPQISMDRSDGMITGQCPLDMLDQCKSMMLDAIIEQKNERFEQRQANLREEHEKEISEITAWRKKHGL